MITYTLTPALFSRLDEARRLQIERYRTIFFKDKGEMPEEIDPMVDRQWMGVKLGEAEISVPIALLTRWGKTFPEDKPLTLKLLECGTLIVSHETGKLRAFTKGLYSSPSSCFFYHKYSVPPAPILLVPDAGDNLSVDLPDYSVELKQLAKETTLNRKRIAWEKSLAKARKVENEALRRLTEATEQANAHRATVEGQTLAAAISDARKILAARRLWAKTLANLISVKTKMGNMFPAWLPATFEADELVSGEFIKVKTETRSYLSGLLATYVEAREKRLAYKPRMQWPCWASTAERKRNPDLGVPVYGPAFYKLKEVEDKAARQVEYFLRERFIEYCAAQGLKGEDICCSYLSHFLRPYSRARLALREWPAQQAELTSIYEEAKAKRVRIEGEPKTFVFEARRGNRGKLFYARGGYA